MLEINQSNFFENTREGLVLLDFSAAWCPPCRMLAPLLEELQNVKVAKVDVDESPDLAIKFGISSIPCMVFLKDGEEVGREVGLMQKSFLQSKVDEYNAHNFEI